MRLVRAYMGKAEEEDDVSVHAHLVEAEEADGEDDLELPSPTARAGRPNGPEPRAIRRRRHASVRLDVRIFLVGVFLALLLGWLVARAA